MMSSLDLALLRFMTAATECSDLASCTGLSKKEACCSALQDRDSKLDYVAWTANIVAFKRRQLLQFSDAMACLVPIIMLP